MIVLYGGPTPNARKIAIALEEMELPWRLELIDILAGDQLTPQFRALMKIEELYEYRDRLTIPKLMLNASGDQFFLPDSSQFYFDELEEGATYEQAASRLGITQSAVSQRAQAAGIVEGRRARELVTELAHAALEHP